MSRRRALTVLEVVVSIALLSGSVAALMQLGATESRAVEMSEERLTAIMLLTEIQQTFNHRAYDFYRAFPSDEGGFDALTESLLAENDTVFDPADTSDTRPVARHLRETMQRMQARRFVLFRPAAPGAEAAGGVVTYKVTYRSKAGVAKQVSTFEVVYPVSGG